MQTAQMLKSLFLGSLLMFSTLAGALPVSEQLFDGKTGQVTPKSNLWARIRPGTVVVIGEQHDYRPHQDIQIQVIKRSQEMGFLTSVGMEFFEYPDQGSVDLWRQGKLTETDFLQAVRWGSFAFSGYRSQVQAPRWGSESVIALNAPRTLTGKIAKTGYGSLTAQELQMLPPQFELGNLRYFERFKAAIGHLPNPEAGIKYFTAQSVWDDTMAWKAREFMAQNPNQVLVIIVGEFHVQYGGGLPDRLRARGVHDIVTISELDFGDFTADEKTAALNPTIEDGARADFIWVTRP